CSTGQGTSIPSVRFTSSDGSRPERTEVMRRVKAVHLIAGLVVVALVGAACSSKTNGNTNTAFKGVPLTGSGATFPQPVYEALFKTLHDTFESGARITYGGGGSGKGISDIQAKAV